VSDAQCQKKIFVIFNLPSVIAHQHRSLISEESFESYIPILRLSTARFHIPLYGTVVQYRGVIEEVCAKMRVRRV